MAEKSKGVEKKSAGSGSLVAKIFTFQGVDRLSSDLLLESTYNTLSTAPYISTPILLGINCDDSVLGGLAKTPGFQVWLDNPDNQPVQNIIQYINTLGDLYYVRVSGNSIYVNTTGTGSWGSPVKTLTATNVRMSYCVLGGYLFLTNGIDPFMYFDGNQFYNIVNGDVSTTLTSDLAIGDTVANVVSTAGFNPVSGFIQFTNGGLTEFCRYKSTTPISFNQLDRNWASSPSVAMTTGGTIDVSYGYPPINVLYVENFSNRVWAANISGQGSYIGWSAISSVDYSFAFDWHIDPNSTNVDSANYTAIYPNDGDQITGLRANGNRLLASKVSHEYVVVPDANGAFSQALPISADFGTFSQASMIPFGNYITHYNQYGLYVFDGSESTNISLGLNDLARNVPSVNLPNVCVAQYDYRLYVSVGSTSMSPRLNYGQDLSNITFVYNTLTNNIFLMQTPFTINCMQTMLDGTGKFKNLYLGDTQGNTYYRDRNQFNNAGTPINMVVQTRYFYFGDPFSTKNYGKAAFIGDNIANGEIAMGFIGKTGKTDYADTTAPLPGYISEIQLAYVGEYYAGVSYLFSETSESQCILYGIQQKYSLAATG